MRTNYQKGTVFESYIRMKLQKKNMYVMKSAGSHTVCDLIAMDANNVYLIQCKTSQDSVPDLKQLLKRTEEKTVKVRTKGNPTVETKKTVDSNVVLLEQLRVPIYTKKFILWKGIGGVMQQLEYMETLDGNTHKVVNSGWILSNVKIF